MWDGIGSLSGPGIEHTVQSSHLSNTSMGLREPWGRPQNLGPLAENLEEHGEASVCGANKHLNVARRMQQPATIVEKLDVTISFEEQPCPFHSSVLRELEYLRLSLCLSCSPSSVQDSPPFQTGSLSDMHSCFLHPSPRRSTCAGAPIVLGLGGWRRSWLPMSQSRALRPGSWSVCRMLAAFSPKAKAGAILGGGAALRQCLHCRRHARRPACADVQIEQGLDSFPARVA